MNDTTSDEIVRWLREYSELQDKHIKLQTDHGALQREYIKLLTAALPVVEYLKDHDCESAPDHGGKCSICDFIAEAGRVSDE